MNSLNRKKKELFLNHLLLFLLLQYNIHLNI